MKSCVLTESFSCDANRVWLYLTNASLGSWRTDVKSIELSADGMQETQALKNGGAVAVQYTEKEKPRRLCGTFTCGRQRGSFTFILLGGRGDTSLECTFSIDGIGFMGKAQKHLQPVLDMLRAVLE